MDEDPEQPVEMGDEDIDSDEGFSGGGLGCEDDDDAGVDDDEPDPQDEQAAQNKTDNIKAPKPRTPLPPWLINIFNAFVLESDTKNRNVNGLPPLYH